MKVEITIPEKDLIKAMDEVEAAVAKEWFCGNKEDYEDWAGDIVGSAMDIFLDKIGEYFGVTFVVD